jgi:hypothetical protein
MIPIENSSSHSKAIYAVLLNYSRKAAQGDPIVVWQRGPGWVLRAVLPPLPMLPRRVGCGEFILWCLKT